MKTLSLYVWYGSDNSWTLIHQRQIIDDSINFAATIIALLTFLLQIIAQDYGEGATRQIKKWT